jgi:hypothetical protein
LLAKASPAVRAESDVLRDLMNADLTSRDVAALPAVPLAIVVAGKYLDIPVLKLPFDARRHFEADLRYRLRVFQEWALASPHGTLLMSNNTTHAIPREDPGLIVSAVQRVLAAAAASR